MPEGGCEVVGADVSANKTPDPRRMAAIPMADGRAPSPLVDDAEPDAATGEPPPVTVEPSEGKAARTQPGGPLTTGRSCQRLVLLQHSGQRDPGRSEERRVGKECRSRW